MNASPSFRQLFRNLHFAAKVPPSWILLHPGQAVNQRLWTAQSDEIIPTPHENKIATVLERIPSGGHFTTCRVPWAAELTKTLFGPSAKINDHLILPIRQDSELVACPGWTQECPATRSIMADASTVRRTFRLAWAYVAHPLAAPVALSNWIPAMSSADYFEEKADATSSRTSPPRSSRVFIFVSQMKPGVYSLSKTKHPVNVLRACI